MMTIADLGKGQSATVKLIDSKDLSDRLHEIGLYPGVQVKVKHIAR